jgi:hypothetical protein
MTGGESVPSGKTGPVGTDWAAIDEVAELLEDTISPGRREEMMALAAKLACECRKNTLPFPLLREITVAGQVFHFPRQYATFEELEQAFSVDAAPPDVLETLKSVRAEIEARRQALEDGDAAG